MLVGIAIGAMLALAGVAVAAVWIAPRTEPTYLRIADDDIDHLLSSDHEPEDGPTSARLIRHCGIDAFTLDLAIPDHAGSAFVNLEKTPRARLNCLIGEARIHGLSLAIVDGEDTASFECLPGWPSRFQRFDPADYGFCPKGEPNPVVGKGPALTRTDR
ncbi:hypothetical protein EEB18_016390 [Sphingopyxis sp. OPL5]|uniref:hypothetical protein n=1 Tax=Sphingopyxis sp. OPL5 TaxID=2486273 RepID=UPI0006F3D423|nr:hypothetical protein [Sphingopyxis sp. OPL5]KQZ64838.1 hypothetical protein ASD67_10470 [Sphingopyxis sp. Root1497]QNO26332.1 hypothetical protein EEB18_016390 [Sphingopyxis sp. OPL5]